MKSDVEKIDIYMRDIDRTLLRENLKLTFEQRAQKHLRALQMVEELRRAGKKLRLPTPFITGFVLRSFSPCSTRSNISDTKRLSGLKSPPC
jgi:hypothetical protein